MSQITSHILDTSAGKPAQGIKVMLFFFEEEKWIPINGGISNLDGRIPDLVQANKTLELGIYKLKFETGNYFLQKSASTFYPFVDIVFEIKDSSHYHVPLLLNPYGYSTYRGS